VTPETPAAIDLWQRTLAQIPTLFGRLAYLASLRNPNANSYQHHGLAARFGVRASQAALKDSHVELLRDWLTMPLAARKNDLDHYLGEMETPRALVIHNWKRLRVYTQYVPVQALKPERELFLGDLEILLEIISRECGGEAMDASAPQFQRPA
jgi:hypothetical protein